MLSITDIDATASISSAAAGAGSVQVISDASDQVWGSEVEVTVIDGNNVRALKCDPPQGVRISCESYDPHQHDGIREPVTLQVLDVHHTGGSMRSNLGTRRCAERSTGADACFAPLVWKTDYPKVDTDNDVWTMTFQFVNVQAGFTATIGGLPPSTIRCGASGAPCTATFTIDSQEYSETSDSMDLKIEDAEGTVVGGAILTNIRANIKPTIGQLDKGYQHWTGQNLLFNRMKIGDSGSVHTIKCEAGVDCHVLDKIKPAETGYMYFIVEKAPPIPFIQVSATGAPIPVFVSPQEEKSTKGVNKNTAPEARTVELPSTPEAKLGPATTLRKRPSVSAIQ